MINVMISDICIILLMLLSAYTTGRPAWMLTVGGMLLICITAGYLKDGEGKHLKTAQLLLAVLFALFMGNWWGCLIFVFLPWPKAWQTMVMTNAVLILELVWMILLHKSDNAAVSLLAWNGIELGSVQEAMGRHGFGYLIAAWLAACFLINLLSILVMAGRMLLRRREQKEEEGRRRIQSYSLSEMHEIQRNKELARQSFYVDKNARLLERENISRNIHNSVGHSITAAIMTLDAADMLFEKKPEEAHKRMNDATERIRGSLGAIRSAVRALDEEAADTSIKDLLCYFDNILNEFLMDTDRTCDRLYEFYDPEREIPREHAEFLTGALEELLTNGVKHGGATHFVVRLSGDSAHLQLEVRDNGRSDFHAETGAELIQNGFGLKKLTSYAERCGGRTSFQNEDGFRAVVELPI
ncbi:MAG: hypothetical protein IKQ25_06235 [Lachnospiraceae bacterium]|nr:hypothetical protein [Lachnospiraceae bacterium]MBR6150864.1 hypothetical protein [Lachnospiraceae bacterium]